MTRFLYKIHVRGHVQGVGFRWSAAHEAKNLGITGFVKNMPDGSVYIEAEGYREQLEQFVEWCRKGPGSGYVDSVDVDSDRATGYNDFKLEH
jgi:acylphosphatase